MTDENGNVTDGYEYDEYGRLFSEAGKSYNKHMYITQEFDSQNSTIYLRKRYYSPALGCFLSRDPSGANDGLNLYMFAQDSPVLYSDITGESSFINIFRGPVNEHWDLVLFQSTGACLLLKSSSTWTNFQYGKSHFSDINKISPIHTHKMKRKINPLMSRHITIDYNYAFCCIIPIPGTRTAGWKVGFKKIQCSMNMNITVVEQYEYYL